MTMALRVIVMHSASLRPSAQLFIDERLSAPNERACLCVRRSGTLLKSPQTGKTMSVLHNGPLNIDLVALHEERWVEREAFHWVITGRAPQKSQDRAV